MKQMNFLSGAFAVMSAALLLSCSQKDMTADYDDVIPQPQEIVKGGNRPFVLNGNVKIVWDSESAGMAKDAGLLAGYIKDITGLELQTEQNGIPDGNIVLSTDLDSDNDEAYCLMVSSAGITIRGASEDGLFYGIQTLRKSLPVAGNAKEITMDEVTINDYPRFPYRGVHFDVSRHFFPADSVKSFIDMMALHNLNTLHWHLTDDQGWRVQSDKYPKLTELGSRRTETVIGRNSGEYDGKPYGGFYTKDEIRDVIAYAAERHINIVPEIDLPGHMQAALCAYPELGCTGGPYEVWKQWGVSHEVLCAGNDKTLRFIDDILGEIMDLFPSEYIHVGGDECPKTRWEQCPKCQARIRSLGLRDDREHTAEQKLQSYVITHAAKTIAARGRKMIGWNEILEGGLPDGAIVMSWIGEAGGIKAAKLGHDVIMTPNTYLYFDYYQTPDIEDEPLAIGGCIPVKTVYGYEPMPEELTAEQQKHIFGVQANLWTEYITSFSQVQYMELPRMAALSEVQWTMPERKDYDCFLSRMPHMFALYDLYGYNYGRHLLNVNVSFVPDTVQGRLGVVMSSIDKADIRYTLDGSEPSASSQLYSDTLWIDGSVQLRAAVFRPSGMSKVYKEDIDFNKATLKPITMLQPINSGYYYDGPVTLVDGLTGNGNYKSRRWIAFVGNDMEAVIDLKGEQEISEASVNLCYNTGDWVYDARRFAVAVSDNGTDFREVAAEDYPEMTEDQYGSGISTHALKFAPVKARYVKVTLSPEYNMPENRGFEAFIFVDEIKLR
jgi:hexosaminidase